MSRFARVLFFVLSFRFLFVESNLVAFFLWQRKTWRALKLRRHHHPNLQWGQCLGLLHPIIVGFWRLCQAYHEGAAVVGFRRERCGLGFGRFMAPLFFGWVFFCFCYTSLMKGFLRIKGNIQVVFFADVWGDMNLANPGKCVLEWFFGGLGRHL